MRYEPGMNAPLPSTVMGLERPDARLMTYYLLSALVIPPLFPFAILRYGGISITQI